MTKNFCYLLFDELSKETLRKAGCVYKVLSCEVRQFLGPLELNDENVTFARQ